MEKDSIPNNTVEKLLADKRVVAEIERHLWIESERVGYDIGYEKAQEDWLKKFSLAWMEYHMPEELLKNRKSAMRTPAGIEKIDVIEQKQNSSIAPTMKRRRAKSYFEIKK